MKRILVPVDGSANSLNAVRAALKICRDGEPGHIHLVNVQPAFHRHISRWISRSARDDFRRERSDHALAPARELIHQAGVPFTSYMMVGTTEDCVADIARNHKCSEIVIGASPQDALGHFFSNSLATRLLVASSIPVKIVPGKPVHLARRVALPVGLGLAIWMLASE